MEDDIPEEVDEAASDNVRPMRPLRRGARRTTISGTSSDDSKAIIAHSKVLETEGAVDRLGLGAVKESLESAEDARRGLTRDIIDLRNVHNDEVARIRDDYERSADATETRHAREALRWREDRDKLRREVDRLEADLKESKKSKKKHKKAVAAIEIQLAELKESGQTKRAVLGILSPGVAPLAEQIARGIPDLIAVVRMAITGNGAIPMPGQVSDEESVQDRAAAIRFASRLFDPKNQDVLSDLQALAVNVVNIDGSPVCVSEWDRIQRCIWSTFQQSTNGQEQSHPQEEEADAS